MVYCSLSSYYELKSKKLSQSMNWRIYFQMTAKTQKSFLYRQNWIGSSISFPSSAKQSTNFIENVTPLDFDNFVPWLCRQLHVHQNVTVIRKEREDYISRVAQRPSSIKSRLKIKAPLDFTRSKETSSSSSSSAIEIKNALAITAYYNPKGFLVALALCNYSSAIGRKIIQAINFSLPFHTTLQRLEVKGSLHNAVLYEISKILPHSNITDVCLDDSILPEGNYYILLQKVSQLQNLSLRRCDINDAVCKMITDTMHSGEPASTTLLVLDLASNWITDVGAKYLGKMLRNNRALVHLNISDNKITDTGATHILEQLTLFPLTKDENLELNRRRIAFFYKLEETQKKCKEDILQRLLDEDKENHDDKKRMTIPKRERSSIKSKTCFTPEKQSVAARAKKMARVIVGEFHDVFDNVNTTRIKGQLHSIGNLKLCSLNLAFNNLSYITVRKVYDVLKYQSNLQKPSQDNGLRRIILDGNNIPKSCEELEAIEGMLELAITKNLQPTFLKVAKKVPQSLSRKSKIKL